jgi:hypothetical protein
MCEAAGGCEWAKEARTYLKVELCDEVVELAVVHK